MLNHIVIMGRLVRDPELRRTGSGIAVASFTVAVDRDFGSKDGGQKETDFIDCVAWRQTGEFVSKYFRKGSMIAVSGRLQIRGWTDKEGNKRKSAEVVADNCYFGSTKKESESTPDSQYGGNYGGGYGGGYRESQYPETEDALRRYGAYPPQAPDNDFGYLTDDDQGLPFG